MLNLNPFGESGLMFDGIGQEIVVAILLFISIKLIPFGFNHELGNS
jgi:hypothetical protein